MTQRGPRRAPGTLVHPMEASGPWLHPPHPASCMEPGGTRSARPRRWLGTPVPGSGRLRAAPVTDHAPQPSDYGAQTRAACMAGPAGLRQGRGPFLSARPTGRQAAGGSRGPGTGAELASIFPSSCHAGQGPSGPEVAFPGEETAQRGGVPGRVPWPGPQGCRLLCGRRPTRVVLRVNHLDRDLQLYPADTPRPGPGRNQVRPRAAGHWAGRQRAQGWWSVSSVLGTWEMSLFKGEASGEGGSTCSKDGPRQ